MFKEKYHKVYRSAADETNHMKRFVENLNAVEKKNDATLDRDTFFILSQYADLDPEEIEERYAIDIKPFHKVSNSKDAEYLGRQRERELKVSQMYDLDNAPELYNDFMKKYGKKNHTKKLEYTKHFYRFVKTLVEINKNNIHGDKNMTLDKNADVIKEPDEYFY
ncbi:unnamed protein product [Danaus chrysippus]|uniref:(African queen) hypothetical protein n=1 Tax=Danaus chrysippus TaxID=151541 RepID=A0A8J2WAY1_9NEOP|nr:unnamed protein product [Danaus chrysippus]